jgi:hypothetical protein
MPWIGIMRLMFALRIRLFLIDCSQVFNWTIIEIYCDFRV